MEEDVFLLKGCFRHQAIIALELIAGERKRRSSSCLWPSSSASPWTCRSIAKPPSTSSCPSPCRPPLHSALVLWSGKARGSNGHDHYLVIIVTFKDELPMFAYYSDAPDSPFCPACTHNRSHTVDLKSRLTSMWSKHQNPCCTMQSILFPIFMFARMAFLHLEAKQLSSDQGQAATRDFFCQVPVLLVGIQKEILPFFIGASVGSLNTY